MTENLDYTFLTRISQKEQIQLLTLLGSCQQLQTIAGRESVIQLLNLNLRNSLNFAATSNTKGDISRLFGHCLRFQDGWHQFMVALEFFEADSMDLQAVQEYLQELGTRYTQPHVTPTPNNSVADSEAVFQKYLDTKNWGAAISYGQELLAKRPRDAQLRSKLAEAYYQNGLALHALGSYEHALEDFNEAVKLVSNQAEFYFARSETYTVLGQADKAQSDLQEAVRRNHPDALLHNRLQNEMIPMQTGGFISDYITHAEYQLFLDNMLTHKNPYWQPDFWTTSHFKPGQARVPIAGLDKWAATEFCQWLTVFDARGYIYRLPTISEAINYSVNNSSLASWCLENNSYKLVGLAPSVEQQFLNKLAMLPQKPAKFSIPTTSTLSFDSTSVRIFNKNLALTLARSTADEFTRFTRPSFKKLVEGLENHNFNQSFMEAKQLRSNVDPVTQRRAILLTSLTEALNAYKEDDVFRGRFAGQRYVMQFAEYAYLGLEMQEREEKKDFSKEKQAAVDLYFWSRLQIERRENGFPAWEGLRVVREPH